MAAAPEPDDGAGCYYAALNVPRDATQEEIKVREGAGLPIPRAWSRWKEDVCLRGRLSTTHSLLAALPQCCGPCLQQLAEHTGTCRWL
jgi:hypothetical protein